MVPHRMHTGRAPQARSFAVEKALIGMVHVQALPGTPFSERPIDEIIQTAVAEARMLLDAGFDGILIENMHDRPYAVGDEVGPEITAAMTAVAAAVRQVADCPLGVQVLASANRGAIAVALASGADYIRAENFAFAHVADEGLMARADAPSLLRYRRAISADHIQIVCDVKKKHASHAITADISLPDAAEAAAFFGADGVVVTGTATGRPTSPADVQAVRAAVDIPVWIGSGVTPNNLTDLWASADRFIVGSYIKEDGLWSNPVEPGRCVEVVKAARACRAGGH